MHNPPIASGDQVVCAVWPVRLPPDRDYVFNEMLCPRKGHDISHRPRSLFYPRGAQVGNIVAEKWFCPPLDIRTPSYIKLRHRYILVVLARKELP